MSKKVLIVKNITHEDAGLVEDILREKNIEYEVVDLSIREKFPDPKNYAAVMVFGGPDSANDDTQKMKEELQKIKEIIDTEIPYLGICLGLQTLVKAVGGNVKDNEIKEVGCRDSNNNYFEINLTEDGKHDLIFKNLNSKLNIFHLHGETIDLNSVMILLATGKTCINQAVKIGKNAYGLQGHFELTEEKLKLWITKDKDLEALGETVLLQDYQDLKIQLGKNARTILNNFLEIAKIIPMVAVQ